MLCVTHLLTSSNPSYTNRHTVDDTTQHTEKRSNVNLENLIHLFQFHWSCSTQSVTHEQIIGELSGSVFLFESLSSSDGYVFFHYDCKNSVRLLFGAFHL